MNNKSDIHYLRKLNHSIPGLVIFILIFFNLIPIELMKYMIFAFYLIISFVEIFRLTHPPFNDIFCKYLYFLLRNKEKKQPTTTTFYLLSLSILLLFTPIENFYIGLMTLAIGDPLASIIGIKNKDNINNYKFPNNKSLYGSLMLSFTGLLFSIIFLVSYSYDFQKVLNYAVIYAINLFLLESFVKHLDDNLYIPLLTIVSYLLIII